MPPGNPPEKSPALLRETNGRSIVPDHKGPRLFLGGKRGIRHTPMHRHIDGRESVSEKSAPGGLGTKEVT